MMQILRCYECKEIMLTRDEGEDYLKGYYGGLCVECNDKLSLWNIFQTKHLGSQFKPNSRAAECPAKS